MRVIFHILIAVILLSGNASAASKSMCPDKVLGTEAVEGVYLGTACEDFCYSTIRLRNGEDLTFLCGEDNAAKFFGQKGAHVKAALELQQFWNELGNECSRQYVCKDGGPLTAQPQTFSLDECIDKAVGVTDSVLQCIRQATTLWDKQLNANYKTALSSLESEQDKAALKAAQQAWLVWRDKMAIALRALDGGGSLSALSANSFILEETQRQAERLKAQQ
ncbi:lysozyme inhibitor LprI family protein [uncultured Desulfovibrio sp.]|uniref:lysozyme inhibitor LprI family protein n=1 Tax=uncultured Desulfovibrio sp. TaxID=167968 RepID=UPI00260925B2|nr:lysozyme inhibitor LprI family protein [uncultured Desulfovibrio sp.]